MITEDWYNLFISLLSIIGTIFTLSQILLVTAKNVQQIKQVNYFIYKDALLIREQSFVFIGLSLLILTFFNQLVFYTKIINNLDKLFIALIANLVLFLLMLIGIALNYNIRLDKCIKLNNQRMEEEKEWKKCEELYKEEHNTEWTQQYNRRIQRGELESKDSYEKGLYKNFKEKKVLWFLFEKDKNMIKKTDEEMKAEKIDKENYREQVKKMALKLK